ncbi:MAG: DUF5683 domain-containing protein [Bacteroidota bacterium]|nr:DUF5683 domain-containing protein [Bacteroidota bacterium]
MRKIIVVLSIIFFCTGAYSQTDTVFIQKSKIEKLKKEMPDSLMEKKHSPTKASVMSAILPGLGQAYNKKYWKIPIIYAGFGVMTYFLVTNTDEYLTYSSAFIEKQNNVTNGNYQELTKKYTADELLSAREYYRRNLDISVLLTALWYGLNIIDATVDAHLFTYNISEDLSMHVQPAMMEPLVYKKYSPGIKICFKF